MTLSTLTTLPLAGLLGLALSIAPARAQDAITGTWTLGVVQTPDYEGSDHGQTLPLLGFRLERGSRYVELQGTALRANVLDRPGIEAGPILNYRFGRTDVDDASVAALDTIDGAFEVGAFAALSLPLNEGALRLSAEVLGDVSGTRDGVVGTLSAGYGRALGDRLSLGLAASLSAASDGYAETYFSVGAAGAAASGLPAFDAGGGIKDAGLDLSLVYRVTDRTSVTGLVSWRRLLGDFADSPVTTRGSPDQVTFGLALTRSF